jgi:hypothetical protein
MKLQTSSMWHYFTKYYDYNNDKDDDDGDVQVTE